MLPLENDPERLTNLPEAQERLVHSLWMTGLLSPMIAIEETFFAWHRHTPFLPFALHWLKDHWLVWGMLLPTGLVINYLGYPWYKKRMLAAKRKRLARLPEYTIQTEGVWPPAPKEPSDDSSRETEETLL